jgi:hypothetical protein
VQRAGGERRGDPLAPSHPDRCPADQGERDVAADAGRQLVQLLLAQPGTPQLVAGDQGGRGVGAAAGQAGRHRDPLEDPDRQARGIARAGPHRRQQRLGGTNGKVAFVRRHAVGPLAGDGHAVVVRRGDTHLVEQGHRVIDRHHIVVAVGPDRAHG